MIKYTVVQTYTSPYTNISLNLPVARDGHKYIKMYLK